ncbi:MAG: DUF2202 domain-containing protein [Lewinellaceae bacterium]|nr:DUF2202 domain-containing protein [Lewinellaceae bacterium]
MKKLLFLLLAFSWPAFQALQAQTALSGADQKSLIYLAEEEKLALDYYQAMEAKWEKKVFAHISEAEQRHLGRAVELAASKGVSLPESLSAGQAGKFHNKELQQLYDELAAGGNLSLEAALRGGARIEEADIQSLKQALETTTDEALRDTYQYLLDASGNHLRAFNKNLSTQGVAYTPVLLPQADFDAIIGAENKESGCQGQNARQGKGCCQANGAGQGKCCKNAQKGNCQGKGKAGASGL